ncbi:MAG: hypothetical protein ACPHYH_06485, partial [Flavobacteriaceae bacterium]
MEQKQSLPKVPELPPEELQELENATYFDKNELKRWYREFLEDYPSGRLTKDDFDRLIQVIPMYSCREPMTKTGTLFSGNAPLS